MSAGEPGASAQPSPASSSPMWFPVLEFACDMGLVVGLGLGSGRSPCRVLGMLALAAVTTSSFNPQVALQKVTVPWEPGGLTEEAGSSPRLVCRAWRQLPREGRVFRELVSTWGNSLQEGTKKNKTKKL